MNFLSLRYFLTVAEILNFTKAAEKLHISQQALSSQVQKLEEELGVELYNRGKRISLTYAGIRFVHYATEILHTEQQLISEMRNIGSTERGKIRIGINPTRSMALLPEILPRFYEEYPHVEVIVMEASPQRMDVLLEEQEVDISIGLRPWYSKVAVEKLCPEMMVALVPKHFISGLFGYQSDIMRQKLTGDFDPRPFARLPMVTLAKGMQVRAWMDDYLAEYGIVPNILNESSGVQTMLTLASRGLGMAYCTETFLYSIWDEVQKPACAMDVFPIHQTRGNKDLGVFYRSDCKLDGLTSRFIQLVREYYQNGEFVYEAGTVRLRRHVQEIQ